MYIYLFYASFEPVSFFLSLMIHLSCQVEVAHFGRLNGADIDMPEWMFSKAMRSARVKYTDHSVLRIIQILGKLGNWRRVLQVIEWLNIRERYKSHRLR